MWLFEQLHHASPAYHIPYRLRLTGNLDREALQQGLREIFCRHTILRSHVRLESGEPVQCVLPLEQIKFPWHDFSSLSAAVREQQYAELAEKVAFQPFDLQAGPFARAVVVRLSDTEHVVLATLHHVAADGASVSIFFQELSALYNTISDGRPATTPELPNQYCDFATRQSAQADTQSTTDVDFWKEQLACAPPLLELPTDRPRPSHLEHAAATEFTLVPKHAIDALRALAHTHGATLFMLMLAAFQVLMARLSGADDVVTGIPVAGRDLPETEALIGCFINVLPLRTRLTGSATFLELLGSIRTNLLASYAHQRLPFPRLVEHLNPDRSTSHPPIVQVLFNYGCNIQPTRLDFSGLGADLQRVAQTSCVDQLGMDVTRAGDDIRCGFLYSTELFDSATIVRWLRHYRNLLESIVANPGCTLARLSLLTTDDRALLLQQAISGSLVVGDRAQFVHRLIEARALQTPDAVAVVLGDAELTYAQLDHRANALAQRLLDAGIGPDAPVGVCLDRSPDLIVAILATWKAGGGYVPMDPSLPRQRLAYIADDSGAQVIVVDNRTAHLLSKQTTRLLHVAATTRDQESPRAPASLPAPTSLAYVIYTSGSTGQPKGVAIEHRSLGNYLLDMQSSFPLDSTDAVLARASIGFDTSIKELFWPLIAGARLILASPGDAADTGYLVALIEAQRITVLMCVPALLAAMLEQPGVQTRCRSLRRIGCGGESLSPTLALRCRALFPDVPLVNGYGPTEATISCSAWVCDGTELHCVPIGHPIAGAELYVLDLSLQLVPLGVAGELYVGGPGVARGYINQPDLTRERFVANPFRPDADGRIYRTGDLVRRRVDGALEFLGRNDDQVKIRGVRIELGEIEAALAAHPGILACAASVHCGSTGAPRLVGYVVPRRDAKLDAHTLRTFLAGSLPEAAIPSRLVILDAMPLTSNGKIDRAALPEPAADIVSSQPLHADDPLQNELIGIWEDMLGVSPIGITDSFFELGGHSLLAVAMLDRVAATWGVKPPLRALFEDPTVRCLAVAILATAKEQTGAVDPPMLCLRTGAPGQTPLFLFHGDLAGGGLYCRKLVQYLDDRLPVYILPPCTAHGVHTVEAQAASVLPYIQSIWQGPYQLAGYCNGGLVAFEAAQQLRALGKDVVLLAVINLSLANAHLRWLFRMVLIVGKAIGLNAAQRDRLFLRLREPTLRFRTERASRRNGWMQRLLTPFAVGLFAARGATHRIQGASRRRRTSQTGNPASAVVDERRRALPDWSTRRERFLRVDRTMSLYMPNHYPGPVTVILSQTDAARTLDPFRGWRAVAPQVDGRVMPGDHLSVVTEHIDRLANVLGTCLQDSMNPTKATPARNHATSPAVPPCNSDAIAATERPAKD